MLEFIKRMQAVLQIRTGFVAVATSVLGLAYSIGIGLEIKWLIMILFITAAFAINIVTNIANGIAGANQEDTLETINDNYRGKNGLVTGRTKMSDAYIALLIFTLYTIGAGLLIVILQRAFWFLAVGIISVLVAIIYSMGPKPLTNYPLTELISGLFCGFLPTQLVIIFNGGEINLSTISLSLLSLTIVGMLMLVNNTCDIQKDLNYRLTLAHLLGEGGCIKLFKLLISFVSLLGLITLMLEEKLVLALIFVLVNFILFQIRFFKIFTEKGTKIIGNKGKYIPRYLKYYYQITIILSILLII